MGINYAFHILSEIQCFIYVTTSQPSISIPRARYSKHKDLQK
jgi:hypothetical protein